MVLIEDLNLEKSVDDLRLGCRAFQSCGAQTLNERSPAVFFLLQGWIKSGAADDLVDLLWVF